MGEREGERTCNGMAPKSFFAQTQVIESMSDTVVLTAAAGAPG
jgi:hypothetical protein